MNIVELVLGLQESATEGEHHGEPSREDED